MNKKVNRNDPCICGSQVKYKKCCQPYLELSDSDKSAIYDEAKERIGKGALAVPTEDEMDFIYKVYKINGSNGMRRYFSFAGKVIELVNIQSCCVLFVKEYITSNPFAFISVILQDESSDNKGKYKYEGNDDPYKLFFGNDRFVSLLLDKCFVSKKYRGLKLSWADNLVKLIIATTLPLIGDSTNYITTHIKESNIIAHKCIERLNFKNYGVFTDSIDGETLFRLYGLRVSEILGDTLLAKSYMGVLAKLEPIN